MEKQLTEIEKIRRDKLNKLLEMNQPVYKSAPSFTDTSKTLNEKYENLSKEELNEKQINCSSVFRVKNIRGPFLIGGDAHGDMQGYIDKKNESLQEVVALIDMGDIIYVEGIVMKTNTGTISIKAKKVNVISKSLKQLPEKWHGLKDQEERYRNRSLDLLVNKETKNIFITRSKIISSIRQFFDGLDYLEVETPILQDILGGASARPFETHHNALDMPFYLRIATELPLKKLLVGGLERVYEIGRIFRNEGIDTTHNPEFTTIEFYESYSDLNGVIKRTEDVIRFIGEKIGKEEFEYKGHKINIQKKFNILNMVEAVNEKTGHDFYKISFDEACEVAKKYKIKIEKFFKVGHIINELFEELVEEELIQPTFVTGHPIEISPLAAKDEKNPLFTQRAELFIVGKEYANLFTELNDPIDQKERFLSQIEEGSKGNDEANEMDYSYIEALEYGMPPAGGVGIGIDRLVMLFTGKESIREVLLFPHLKERNK